MFSTVAEIIDGEHRGVVGFVTWTDGEFVRVTPVDSDPLHSIQVSVDQVLYKQIDLQGGPAR